MELILENLSKHYGATVAVDSVSLRLPSGQALGLLGTSGCGKTTTLKMINRLVTPTGGRVLLDGQDTATLDVVRLRRSIGYVVQGAGLFPHLSVADNVSLMARAEGWPPSRITPRVLELLGLVRLDADHFSHRYPGELSGGQQQRVGVARALMLDPPLILMDEPFGALDPITRHEIQQEFVDLRKRLGKTLVFVTHDLTEALRMADQIGVMNRGSLEQLGPADVVWRQPATDFVRRFVTAQVAPGQVTQ